MSPLRNTLLLTSLIITVYTLRFLSTSNGSQPTRFNMTYTPGDVSVQVQTAFCSDVPPFTNFTDHQHGIASGIQNFLSHLHKGNSLLYFIQGNNPPQNLGHKYMLELAPYAALGLLLLFVSLVMIVCFCCKCRCCKSCIEADEERRGRWIGLGLVFSALIITVAGLGIEASQNSNTYFQQTNCAATTLITELNTGNLSKKWIGFTEALYSLSSVNDSWSSAISNLTILPPDTSSVNSSFASLNQSIYDYYTDNKDLQVMNPEVGTDITPLFIQNLGPPTNSSTYSGDILSEAQNHSNSFFNILQLANTSIINLNSTPEDFQTALDNAVSISLYLDIQFDTISKHYQIEAEKGVKLNQDIAKGLYGYFISSTAITAIILLVLVNTILCQFTFFQKCFKLTYICLYLSILISFVILTLGFPMLIAVGEGCATAQAAFRDSNTFDNIVRTFFSKEVQVLPVADTCIFGDGNMARELGIEGPLMNFNSLYQSIVEYNDTFANASDSVVIPAQQVILRQIKNYTMVTNPEIQEGLDAFNQFTNFRELGTFQTCRECLDTWYLSNASCTGSDGIVFEAEDSDTYNYGNATCLGFSEFPYQMDQRYNSTDFQSCPSINGDTYQTYVTGFGKNFLTHIADVKKVFGQVSQNIVRVINNNTDFMDTAKGLLQNISSPGDATQTAQTIGDPATGIYPNFNCSSAKNNSQDFVHNFCAGYLPSVFVLILLALLYAVFGLVLLLPLIAMDRLEQKRADQKKRYEESLIRVGELY